MKAEIYPGADGWRFRVRAHNGEILCAGESYVRRIDAENALRQLFSGGSTEVVVRGHGQEVTGHYTLGQVLEEDAGECGDEELLSQEPQP
jgi:uncharacterized protein YegP (UPF0339 family)